MSTKRKNKPKNHRLTQYIKVLSKQNSWNNYAVCLACSENLEENELSKLTFTNKKPQVKNHLKNCEYFKKKIGSQEEVGAIINLTDNENEEIEKNKHLRADSDSGKIGREKVLRYLESMQSNLNTVFFKTIEGEISSTRSFVSTSTSITSSSKRHLHLVKTGDNVLENILVQTPTKKEQPIFERLLLKASDISSERERMIEIIPKIEGLIKDARDDLDAKVIAIISDSAAAYAEAQYRLRLEYPHIVFLLCFAHQCQLAICDIFKESPSLKNASFKAITIAAYFKSGNNSYFIDKLRDIQKELYKKYYSIMVPCETRWNSHYYCFKSLVRSKQALRNLAIQHERPQSAPAEASTSTSNNTNEIYLNKDICKILLDNNWWDTIEALQEILLPYCVVLNKLQSDKARLFELLHALGYFIQFWNQYSNVELRGKMIERLEKRWYQWEQPLLLLSFMLHPKYRLAYFNSGIENLTFITLGRYLTYYYKAWFQKRPTRLLLDFEDYCQKIEPFNDETFNQFGDDVFKFWKYVEGNYKELASIALRIFGICNDKVLSISKLYASINFSFRKKELQKNKIEFLDLNAKPVNDNLQQNPANDDDDFDEIIRDEDNIITSER
ncbi:hypothetical protein RclHR1_05650013 [Rhizophagus clarus]|uniref:DUF659 domain-containing protein n=1 Tax=Rhizophagus clarus TaxID=94130 RepID=A0A2Z6S0X3_9GLOM|nr:hypothetical protein RclHR1_05650013 [Rhizophagus clarus]